MKTLPNSHFGGLIKKSGFGVGSDQTGRIEVADSEERFGSSNSEIQNFMNAETVPTHAGENCL